MAEVNRQIVLERLPKADRLAPEHFRFTEAAMPSRGPGEVLLRVRYISLDAANRAWMQGATYRSAIEAGDVMAGAALAEVMESDDPRFKPGDLVFADAGWQDFAAMKPADLIKLPALEPVTHLLSVYGIGGLTAYFGLLKCGEPKAGETVVVSAAAGSVGSLVGQIAKLKGCRVVGIAGGAEKGRWLIDELGFDAVVDYKAGNLRQELKAAAPGGIDVYFDNVGGDMLETCLFAMKLFGRVVCCGAVSQYDGLAPPHGPRGIPGLMITKRLTLRGFVVTDFDDQRDEALAQLQGWVASGKLKVQEDIMHGLENTPAALIDLLAGGNRGKRMVKVS